MSKPKASIFEMDGVPEFGQALPLALQHVVAMIVGCVTPSIIVAGVADLAPADRVILIQAALFVSSAFPCDQGKKFPAWSKASRDHGHQLCLCTQYAGYRRPI